VLSRHDDRSQHYEMKESIMYWAGSSGCGKKLFWNNTCFCKTLISCPPVIAAVMNPYSLSKVFKATKMLWYRQKHHDITGNAVSLIFYICTWVIFGFLSRYSNLKAPFKHKRICLQLSLLWLSLTS
jgi:hypothetical protein